MDYSTDPDANLAAHDAASQFGAGLDRDPSFGGLAIVASGLRVYVVEPPSETVTSAIDAMRTLVPVETHAVRNSLGDLMDVTEKLNQAHDSWTRRGILLSSWGPHVTANLVEVRLQVYEPQFAQALVDAYGADVLTVATEPETIVALS